MFDMGLKSKFLVWVFFQLRLLENLHLMNSTLSRWQDQWQHICIEAFLHWFLFAIVTKMVKLLRCLDRRVISIPCVSLKTDCLAPGITAFQMGGLDQALRLFGEWVAMEAGLGGLRTWDLRWVLLPQNNHVFYVPFGSWGFFSHRFDDLEWRWESSCFVCDADLFQENSEYEELQGALAEASWARSESHVGEWITNRIRKRNRNEETQFTDYKKSRESCKAMLWFVNVIISSRAGTAAWAFLSQSQEPSKAESPEEHDRSSRHLSIISNRDSVFHSPQEAGRGAWCESCSAVSSS